MAELPWLRRFIEPLNKSGVEYMVTGSVAAMAHGEPRLTIDVDIVVHMEEAQVAAFLEAYAGSNFYCPPRETICKEIRRGHGGHFNIIENNQMMKANFFVAASDPLHRWALERTEPLMDLDYSMRVAPLEYVFIRKLEWIKAGGGPDRHTRDIASAIAVSGDSIDLDFVHAEIQARSLQGGWAEVERRLALMAEAEKMFEEERRRAAGGDESARP